MDNSWRLSTGTLEIKEFVVQGKSQKKKTQKTRQQNLKEGPADHAANLSGEPQGQLSFHNNTKALFAFPHCAHICFPSTNSCWCLGKNKGKRTELYHSFGSSQPCSHIKRHSLLKEAVKFIDFY